MIKIKVSFKPDSFKRYLSALRRVHRTVKILQNDHPMRLSYKYMLMLREAIVTQKYSTMYPAYSPRYYHWKRHVFGSNDGFWQLRGYVLGHITHRREGAGTWFGGIPGEIIVPDVSITGRASGTIRLSDYAAANEFGDRVRPARPLFRPTFEELADEGSSEEMRQSALKILGAWR